MIKLNKRQKKKYRNRAYYFHYKDFKRHYQYTCKAMKWNERDNVNRLNFIELKETVRCVYRYNLKYRIHLGYVDTDRSISSEFNPYETGYRLFIQKKPDFMNPDYVKNELNKNYGYGLRSYATYSDEFDLTKVVKING